MTVLWVILLAAAAGLCFRYAVKFYRHYQVKPQVGALNFSAWAFACAAAVLGALLFIFFYFNPPSSSFGRL